MKGQSILIILTLWTGATNSAFAQPVDKANINSLTISYNSNLNDASSSKNRQCPDVDDISNIVTFPSLLDCAEFYVCSMGLPISFRCLGDLQWNDIQLACDIPENVNCMNGERPSGDQQNVPDDPSYTMPPAIEHPHIECPQEIGIHTFPHPLDCSRYYMCADHIPYPRNCPTDLLFNPNIGVCDWKWNMMDKCKVFNN